MQYVGYLFSLVSIVCWIMIVISAFKNTAWKGVVALLCGLYALYYGFTEFENPNKIAITLGMLICGILGGTLRTMGMMHR